MKTLYLKITAISYESFLNKNEAQINSFLTSYFEPTQLFFYLNLILQSIVTCI